MKICQLTREAQFLPGYLWLVSRLYKGFKAVFDEFCAAAAKIDLLAEQVGLGFFCEGGLYYSGSCSTDCFCDCEDGVF